MTICHTMTLCQVLMTTCHIINKLTLINITDKICLQMDNNNVTN